VRIFQWLAPAAFVGSFNPIAWAWVSLNQTDRMLRWTAIATPFIVAGFAAGVPFGGEGVAAAFSITQLSLRYFSINYCYRGNFLSFRILFEATWQATVASLGSMVPVLALSWFGLFPHALLLSALLKGVLYALCYFGLWRCLPGGRRALRETFSLWRDLRPAAREAGKVP
jgi:hypothetical protein